MLCGTSEIILSFPQKERITEQVHNDDAMKNHRLYQKNEITTPLFYHKSLAFYP